MIREPGSRASFPSGREDPFPYHSFKKFFAKEAFNHRVQNFYGLFCDHLRPLFELSRLSRFRFPGRAVDVPILGRSGAAAVGCRSMHGRGYVGKAGGRPWVRDRWSVGAGCRVRVSRSRAGPGGAPEAGIQVMLGVEGCSVCVWRHGSRA